MKKIKILLTFLIMLVNFSIIISLWSQERREVKGRRSYHSKTFVNKDGTYTTEISAGYVHYKNPRAEYVESKRDFRPSTNPKFAFEVTEGLYQVFFDKTSAAGAPSL